MSQSLHSIKEFGGINLGQIFFNNKGSVTQATNLSTAVTLNSFVGTINTVSTTLATAGSSSFACNNSNVTPNSIVFATLQKYSGSNGAPKINVSNITSGSFTVNVQNVHDTAALNGVLTVGFMVV
jgi:hypothetical protein